MEYNSESLCGLRIVRKTDETLPNFIKRKPTQERERKRNKGARTKVQKVQANSPKEAGQKEVREPLST